MISRRTFCSWIAGFSAGGIAIPSSKAVMFINNSSAGTDTARLAPDVLIAQDNLTGVVGDINEDVSSPTGVWLNEVDDALDTSCHVSFPTPTGDPTVGTDLQNFKLYVRRSTTSGGNDPTITVSLFENGSFNTELLTAQSVTSLTGETITVPWNASLLSTASGINVELFADGNRSGGGPTARRTVEFDAVEWNVEYDL
jgi:hypothetical protein